MHPIHYSMTLGVLTLVLGSCLSWYLAEPLLFVLAVFAAYLLGAQTVGQFGPDGPRESANDKEGDYQGTAAGFVKDDQG